MPRKHERAELCELSENTYSDFPNKMVFAILFLYQTEIDQLAQVIAR